MDPDGEVEDNDENDADDYDEKFTSNFSNVTRKVHRVAQ
jgi:hypothetical protein